MKKLKKAFCGALFAAALSAQGAWATTYYISPSGDNANSGLSESAPKKTFANAFAAMTNGDELVLLDGTYSASAGTGYINFNDGSCSTCGQPKSGVSLNAMTVVRAKNPGSVTVDGNTREGLFLGRTPANGGKVSFIKIQGITFKGGGSLFNTSYCTIKDCGFYHARQDDSTIFGIGTIDHSEGNTYNLVEDCWIWGKDRILASNYRADHNVWRRVVLRGDGCNTADCTGSGNPNVGFTIYNSSFVSVQNMIVVDRVLGGGYEYGDFATAQHDAALGTDASEHLGNDEWLGSISLNSEDTGFHFESDAAVTNHPTVKNCVAWDNGGNNFNLGGSQNPPDADNFAIENLTAGLSGSTSSGIRFLNATNGTFQNMISHSAGTYNFASDKKPSYVVADNSASNRYQVSGGACVTGCGTANPLSDGTPPSLKYLLRIEDGSALDGAGNGGADIGATVVKRYGVDGSRHGETDFNTLSATDLWPWPNQSRIKSDMCASETRGFCGKSSLTEYIWTYLGSPNPYPGDTVDTGGGGGGGGGGDSETTRPTLVSATAGSLTSVSVVFSESVDETSAETASNYAVTGNVAVSGATLESDLKTVKLATSQHAAGNTYTLTVNNVKDRAATPNTILDNSTVQYTVAADVVTDNLKPNNKHLGEGGSVTFGTDATEVVILDSKGNEIFQVSNSGGAIVWSGQDTGGRKVESGLYIAQIKDASGKTVYAPVVVVK